MPAPHCSNGSCRYVRAPFAQNSNKQKQQILLLLKSDASVYVSRKLAWLHDILKSYQLPNQNFHATILDVTICPGKESLWLGGQEVLSLWTMQWNGYVFNSIFKKNRNSTSVPVLLWARIPLPRLVLLWQHYLGYGFVTV